MRPGLPKLLCPCHRPPRSRCPRPVLLLVLAGTVAHAAMAYNVTRQSKQLLDSYKDALVSLSVQLYPDHWTLNSGSKFLYNSPAAVQ